MKKLDRPIIDRSITYHYSATIGELLDALDKNGYPWAQNDFYYPLTEASCAIGQIGRNLGFDPQSDRTVFWNIDGALYGVQKGDDDYKRSLIGINDHHDTKDFETVKEKAHEIWDQYRDVEVMF